MQHLEMHMRSELPPMCGRDHMSYRSSYHPIKVGRDMKRLFDYHICRHL